MNNGKIRAGNSTTLLRKKLRYGSPARSPVVKAKPKYTRVYVILQTKHVVIIYKYIILLKMNINVDMCHSCIHIGYIGHETKNQVGYTPPPQNIMIWLMLHISN